MRRKQPRLSQIGTRKQPNVSTAKNLSEPEVERNEESMNETALKLNMGEGRDDYLKTPSMHLLAHPELQGLRQKVTA